jgi:hypothetical protein
VAVTGAWSSAGKYRVPAQVTARSAYVLGPLPTISLTFAPFPSLLPGFGFSPSTLPLFFEGEKALVILPTLQWALRIRAVAFASVRP